MSHSAGRSDPRFSVVVLAGERPGGSEFGRRLGLPASVLVDVDGQPALQRVVDALKRSNEVRGGVLCGPSEAVFKQHREFAEILSGSGIEWIAPRPGPSESAVSAAESLNRFPILLTAGDHALLTPQIVDDFCRAARQTCVDGVIGVVPHERVRAAFPDTRRTVHRFRDGGYCGSNLFALLNADGMAAPRFWRRVEADRKKPWRIARRVGILAMLRYALRRLTLDQAMTLLSEKMGCRMGCVSIDAPRAAVDVDSLADRDLAVRVLRSER